MQQILSRYRNERGFFSRWLTIAIILLLIAAVIAPEQVVGPLGSLLVHNDPPEKGDAIVVLLGGDTPERILKAYDLYQKGYAPRIVFGSGFEDREVLKTAPSGFVWLPQSAAYSGALHTLNVPKGDVIVVDTHLAFDSSSELETIARFAEQEKWRKVILVTSMFHSGRTDIIWNRVGRQIPHVVIVAPVPQAQTWWKSSRLTRAVGYEYGAMVKELFRQVMSAASVFGSAAKSIVPAGTNEPTPESLLRPKSETPLNGQ